MNRAYPAVLAGIICGIAGLKHAANLRKSAAELVRWAELLRQLALLLREATMSLPAVFCQAAAGSQAPDDLLRQLASEMRSQPLLPLPELYRRITAAHPAPDAIGRMMDRIWHGSLESRVLAVQQAADEVEHMAATAQTKAARDARMWAQLGWTFGACLTLILL